jgi:phosphomannomutase
VSWQAGIGWGDLQPSSPQRESLFETSVDADVYGLTGRLYEAEDTWPRNPEMRVALPRAMREAPASHAASYPVVRTSHMDGTKLYLENDNWVLLRFSGTEPVLRLTVEADSPNKARELLDWLKQFVAACK